MSDSYILEIKNKRKDFINSFEKNIENIDNELIRASNDNQLNSIRIHKYLTETGVLGKVKTARFLDDIGLNEKSKFSDLNDNYIESISNYVKNSWLLFSVGPLVLVNQQLLTIYQMILIFIFLLPIHHDLEGKQRSKVKIIILYLKPNLIPW